MTFQLTSEGLSPQTLFSFAIPLFSPSWEMRLAGAQLWGILINQIKDIVLGSHGMLLSSGGTLNEMEHQEGGSSSIPGRLEGLYLGM